MLTGPSSHLQARYAPDVSPGPSRMCTGCRNAASLCMQQPAVDARLPGAGHVHGGARQEPAQHHHLVPGQRERLRPRPPGHGRRVPPCALRQMHTRAGACPCCARCATCAPGLLHSCTPAGGRTCCTALTLGGVRQLLHAPAAGTCGCLPALTPGAGPAGYLRARDPSRPVHYEGGGARTAATDIVCPMYARVHQIQALADDPSETRPIIQCEYAHAMGNGLGNYAEYWAAFEAHPCLQVSAVSALTRDPGHALGIVEALPRPEAPHRRVQVGRPALGAVHGAEPAHDV